MEIDTQLIDAIDAFLGASGWTPTRFGKDAFNDPNLVFDIREGRWLRGPNRDRVLTFIKEQNELLETGGQAA